MHQLTLLNLDLSLLDIPDNPFNDTLPALHKKLQGLVHPLQSYGTMLASINELGVYARGGQTNDGRQLVVIVRSLSV
jgi:hypothetical protein